MGTLKIVTGAGRDFDALGAYEVQEIATVPDVQAVLADRELWHFLFETPWRDVAEDAAATLRMPEADGGYGAEAEIEEEFRPGRWYEFGLPTYAGCLEQERDGETGIVFYRVFARGRGAQ